MKKAVDPGFMADIHIFFTWKPDKIHVCEREGFECIRSCTTIRSAFHLAHVTYTTMYLEEGKADFAKIERTLTCLPTRMP